MMTSSRSVLLTLIAGLGAAATSSAAPAEQSRPFVMPRPAVQYGSNLSRAPFPANRPFDDVKGPDGKAIDDDLPPNAPATTIDAPPPPPRIAIFQDKKEEPATSSGVAAAARTDRRLGETLGAAALAPTLRSAPHGARDRIVADAEQRLSASEAALASLRQDRAQMSAEARQAFDPLATEAQEKAAGLRKSLERARRANAADWESARAQLASDFDAYAGALARLEAGTR